MGGIESACDPGGLCALTCVYEKARVELELLCDLRGTGTGLGADGGGDMDVDVDVGAPDGRGCAGWLSGRPQTDCEFEADSESDVLSQASSSPHSVVEKEKCEDGLRLMWGLVGGGRAAIWSGSKKEATEQLTRAATGATTEHY